MDLETCFVLGQKVKVNFIYIAHLKSAQSVKNYSQQQGNEIIMKKKKIQVQNKPRDEINNFLLSSPETHSIPFSVTSQLDSVFRPKNFTFICI